jgi:hypothetical protein
MSIQCPAGLRGRGDPAGALAPRRLPGPPAESEYLEHKSTANFNTAFLKKAVLILHEKFPSTNLFLTGVFTYTIIRMLWTKIEVRNCV